MTEDELVLVRRKRLAEAASTWFDGNESAFARAVGRQPSQISDMAAGRKSFGGKVARRLEKALQEAGVAARTTSSRFHLAHHSQGENHRLVLTKHSPFGVLHLMRCTSRSPGDQIGSDAQRASAH